VKLVAQPLSATSRLTPVGHIFHIEEGARAFGIRLPAEMSPFNGAPGMWIKVQFDAQCCKTRHGVASGPLGLQCTDRRQHSRLAVLAFACTRPGSVGRVNLLRKAPLPSAVSSRTVHSCYTDHQAPGPTQRLPKYVPPRMSSTTALDSNVPTSFCQLVMCCCRWRTRLPDIQLKQWSERLSVVTGQKESYGDALRMATSWSTWSDIRNGSRETKSHLFCQQRDSSLLGKCEYRPWARKQH
jgi:hypothetical protein